MKKNVQLISFPYRPHFPDSKQMYPHFKNERNCIKVTNKQTNEKKIVEIGLIDSF